MVLSAAKKALNISQILNQVIINNEFELAYEGRPHIKSKGNYFYH